ncbi:MAG: hypothetical protein WAO95_02300 [Burkholderiales bacterium]
MSARTSSFRPELTPEAFNGRSAGHLPGPVGLRILALFRSTQMVLWPK